MTGLHRCPQGGEAAVQIIANIGKGTTNQIRNILIGPPVHVNQKHCGALSKR